MTHDIQFSSNEDIRDRFAMAALSGLLSDGEDHLKAAYVAYDIADAMILARQQGRSPPEPIKCLNCNVDIFPDGRHTKGPVCWNCGDSV